jgi:thymidylate synthase (FAD)
MKLINQSATLLSCTPNAAQLIEAAGRTCYKSEDRITPESAAPFIAMIIKRGHLSVLEHASATIRFITDRGITHELVRHRIAAYSQESTRYVKYGDIDVVLPVDENGTCPLGICGQAKWGIAMEAAETAYKAMIDLGISPQFARSVLPNSLKTEIMMTTNFREWIHVLCLREAPAAHPQMRHLMTLARAELVKACPEVFGAKD